MKLAFSSYENVSIVYPSNWYYDNRALKLYSSSDTSLFKESINYLSYKIYKKFKSKLFVLKSRKPVDEIENFCIQNNVDIILYDLPLSSNKLKFSGSVQVIEVDSDSYIPDCNKMTAKSRWMFWDRNRISEKYVSINNIKAKFYRSIGDEHKVDVKQALQTKEKIKSKMLRLKSILDNYKTTRNAREGSSNISAYLHHGIVDARDLVHLILAIAGKDLQKENKYVPFLRQLAFREISIKKTRDLKISLYDSSFNIANKILDKESIDNLKCNEFDPVFTKEQLFSGNTGFEKLDREVKLCIKNRWMPNRARMWFAGECYWGLGGGFKSLSALIEFFNLNCDDAQSPNNVISCVECMRLKYGKVMKYNGKRTFRLLEGKEVIK
jgi:hypothetical protein